ncbi:MAG: sugar phosphate isomerase/epimerase [Armatimonadetes bacterium]|nr:sugar phosphate isomerase/epimerase [Armatimonadota bacterium]
MQASLRAALPEPSGEPLGKPERARVWPACIEKREGEDENGRAMMVGAQLYVYMQEYERLGWDFEASLDEILGEIREAGYQAVEGFLHFCATKEGAEHWRGLLARYDLRAPSLYTGGNLYEPPPPDPALNDYLATLAPRHREVLCARFGAGDNPPLMIEEIERALGLSRRDIQRIEGEALSELRQLARHQARLPGVVDHILEAAQWANAAHCQALVINPDVKRERKTDAELRWQAFHLDLLGAGLKRLEMALWIHNHDAEMRDNARELRANLDWTDPNRVGFCADVHWIWRGGGDPYAYLERYGSRVGSLHLRNSRGGVWSEELGDGDVDYRRVAAILREQGFRGPLVVELAIETGTPQTRPLAESLRLSRAYVQEVFGV